MQIDIHSVLWFVGRLLMGSLFVVGGVRHFQAIAPIAQAMAARGVPAAKATLVAGSVFQILAGLALIVGFHVAWAALGLIVFTLAASLMLVNFWSMQGAARENALNTWHSNFAIIGGLLVTTAQAL